MTNNAMEYLLIYLGIGLLIVLWDFRRYGKILLWSIRYITGSDPFSIPPIIESWDMLGYVRRRNWFVAILFIFFWPIKVFITPPLSSFIRNVRYGRIKLWERHLKIKRYIFDSSLKEYTNIFNYLLAGIDSGHWIEFRIDGRKVVIHNKKISYDKTLEELNCPDRAMHDLYAVKQGVRSGDIVWDVEEAHNPFNVRLSGYGNDDRYEENKDGEITHLEQTESWVS